MSASHPSTAAKLERAPLYDLHIALGARMVPFAGYEMPLHYGPGILKEHLHARSAAGLFDVSHMGQVTLRPIKNDMRAVCLVLESLVPIDVVDLGVGRQRYALLTNPQGGILDDMMVANRGDHLAIVVNASRKEFDLQHLRKYLSENCKIDVLSDRSLLALQGPQASSVLSKHAPEVGAMRFMDVRTVDLAGISCDISRSGYTGEDGFEISVPSDRANLLAGHILADTAVAPIGLGARDSLRLEAGLCLYGADLDPTTSPVDAALEWSIQKSRRSEGSRSGGFPGSEIILPQLRDGSSRRRVGLRARGGRPVRAGAQLFDREREKSRVGIVTSGGFGPSVNGPVAMGYVESAYSKTGTEILADVRGTSIELTVCDIPFVPHRFKRN
jgi:aminomethyltransferase